MKRFKVIENKKDKTHYVVDSITGECIRETENPDTARRIARELNREDTI